MQVPPIPPLKPLRFSPSSYERLKEFSPEVQRLIGEQLLLVQAGRMPEDWKPIASVGPGAIEIRVHSRGEFRAIYVAKFSDAIYVLNIFQKKSQKTPLKELKKAKNNYAEAAAQSKKQN